MFWFETRVRQMRQVRQDHQQGCDVLPVVQPGETGQKKEKMKFAGGLKKVAAGSLSGGNLFYPEPPGRQHQKRKVNYG